MTTNASPRQAAFWNGVKRVEGSFPARIALMRGLQRSADLFRRSLLVKNKAPKTVTSNMDTTRLFDIFLSREGMPYPVAHIHFSPGDQL